MITTNDWDTQPQCEMFDIYVKQNPGGRQVHHTGTLGYDDCEWQAFQFGWNAAKLYFTVEGQA